MEPPFEANEPDIRAHIEWLTEPVRGKFDDALVEIAFGTPANGPNRAKLFALNDVDAAVTFAVECNREGCNVYIGAALRSPKADRNRRTSLADFYVATAVGVDIDHDHDDARVRFNTACDAGLVVTTGVMPSPRSQVWTRLSEPELDSIEYGQAQVSLVAHAGADENAKDPARIMRLGGTVSYPRADKIARGYRIDRTTVDCDPAATPSAIKALQALAPRHRPAAGPPVTSSAGEALTPETIADLESALGNISADDYDAWMRNGQRLKKSGVPGRDIWMKWSAISPKFNAQEAAKKWDSFAPSRTGYRAIFTEAQKMGWKNPRTPYWADVEILDCVREFVREGAQQFGPAAPVTAEAQFNKPGNEEVPPSDVKGDTDGGTGEWPEPKPIQAALHPVPAFDPDALLPEALRDWIMDEADRMPCPPDFIAAGVVVALGAIIGARCTIKPKSRDSWLIVPNLWGGVVGLPSAKKSPAIGAALKPLGRLIARAMEAYQADVEAFEADKTVFEAKKEAIENRIKAAAKDTKKGDLDSIARELQGHRQQAPEVPTLRRYKSNDTTVEKLGELLRENPSGLLVMRDELVGLIASWDKEGREGERAFYLEAWNGDASFDTDRIGRGSIFIPNLCVSIFGGIQPDKLTGYLEQAANALANDGMLQRFQLLVFPDHRAWEWRDRIPAKDARDRAFGVFDTLADFDPVVWGAAPVDDVVKFPHFRFDDAAQKIFIEWSSDLHRVRLPAEDHPIIAQHLAKFDKLFPALALILHLTDCAATGKHGPVTAAAASRAAAWCGYLEAHARRCYGLLTDDGLRAAQALAGKVRQGKLSDGFTARDVRRNQWRNLTSDEAVQAALDWLEDEGWLRAAEVGGAGPGTGRRTWRYFINPKTAKAGNSGSYHGEQA